MKRLFDLVVSAIGLVLAAPVLLGIAAAIRLADGAPVLFRQVRVGRGGKDFSLIKFRTMAPRRDAEKGAFDAGSSARVTWLGRILRKTKLDELPQLWNVLRGDMSLVGPRPEVRKWVDVYPDRWAGILAVRPGITDPASIRFRNEEEILAQASDPDEMYRRSVLPRKLDLYEKYIHNQSFYSDLVILLQTFHAVLSGRTPDAERE